ncbi:hypothetical protein HID58_042698 [Brassica napus]|uniref:Uncharacterized protein n=1 Tax=Brassica napus TaxID=3708 RepID=A0ABQ8BEH0_BRANA|nr:hypothetical protein HID58_042698 [Brassica napus]
MGSSVITSLSLSFKQVPPTAVPTFLDYVLSSTGVSPSTLFESLIKELSFRAEKFPSDDCNHIASLVAGLCHLLKSFDNHNALQLFVWRVFVPLMKMVRAYDLDMLNKTSALVVLEVSLVPFFTEISWAGMLCDLCNTTERLLSQSVVHRSCAVSFLLPAIFKAFSSQSSLKISLQGNVYVLSSYKFQEWLQKKNMGMLQEAVLGWINRGLSSGSWMDGTESYVSEKDPVEFDFRSEHEFWEEIKKDLIWQKYLLVRKQSLHILKSVLSISEVSKTIFEKNCMALLNLLC